MHRRLNHKDEIRMNDIVNLVGLVTVDKSGTNVSQMRYIINMQVQLC